MTDTTHDQIWRGLGRIAAQSGQAPSDSPITPAEKREWLNGYLAAKPDSAGAADQLLETIQLGCERTEAA